MYCKQLIISLQKLMFATLFVVAGLAAPGLADDDITGEWELTLDFGGQDLFATLAISQDDDGVYAGSWGTTELSDVSFDGETLTFDRPASFGGNEFVLSFSAALEDGQLEGQVGNEQMELPVNGVRQAPAMPVIGHWDISFSIQDREMTARLSVTNGDEGELDAEWIAEFGEHTVTGVSFEEGQLTVDRTVKFQDQEIAVTYLAEIEGDTMTGKLESPLGEVEANGTRFGAELIGTWALTATTDEGSRERMLKVYPDLTGRYDFFLAEIPVEVTLEDGDVSFHGEVAFGDRAMATDFTGTVGDDGLMGELVTPRGTSEVSGKRVE